MRLDFLDGRDKFFFVAVKNLLRQRFKFLDLHFDLLGSVRDHFYGFDIGFDLLHDVRIINDRNCRMSAERHYCEGSSQCKRQNSFLFSFHRPLPLSRVSIMDTLQIILAIILPFILTILILQPFLDKAFSPSTLQDGIHSLLILLRRRCHKRQFDRL